jgi:protein SCO1/2
MYVSQSVGRATYRRYATLTIFLAAVSLAACGQSEVAKPERALRGVTRTPAPNVAKVTLPNVTTGARGKSFAMRASEGGLLLVYFGYTSCPDVCPTTLADIKGAIGKLPAKQRKLVMPVMATDDPSRDTPAVLNGYLSHFFDSWRALRSTDRRVFAKAEKAFHAAHKKGPVNEYGAYEISHTAYTYAVDDEGVIRVEWPFGSPSADIAADLTKLLAAPQPSSQTKTTEE